jgi:hypothetical protein
MGKGTRKEIARSKSADVECRSLVEALCEQVGEIDEASIENDGSITFRREIFYRHPQGVERFRLAVTKALRARNIRYVELQSGEAWQPFSDATSLTGRSFWYVKVRLTAFISPSTYDRTSRDR